MAENPTDWRRSRRICMGALVSLATCVWPVALAFQFTACSGPADRCQVNVIVVARPGGAGLCTGDLSVEVSSVDHEPQRVGFEVLVDSDSDRATEAGECDCRRANFELPSVKPAGTYLATARLTGYGTGTATFQVSDACAIAGTDPLIFLEPLSLAGSDRWCGERSAGVRHQW